MTQPAVHLQGSPQHGRQPPANRQTKTRATVGPARRAVDLAEVFENLDVIGLGDANARVDDGDRRRCAWRRICALIVMLPFWVNFSALLSRFTRICFTF